MRRHEDPQEHFERHMDRSAKRYVVGLQKAGLEPNDKLTRAMAERALAEARSDYGRTSAEVRDHNLKVIVKGHNRRMNAIKREGASLRLKTCLPIALVLGMLAWYNFGHPGGFWMGVCYLVGAFAFLAMLVLGALFDRPRE